MLSIFGWLKEPGHIVSLVAELLSETNTNRDLLVNKTTNLINMIISSEVKLFCQYLADLEDFEKAPHLNVDDYLSEGMSFLLELQKELFYQLGQKVQDKSLELSPIFVLASNWTEIISRQGVLVNESFELKIKELARKVDESLKKSEEEEKEEEIPAKKKDEKIVTIVKKNDKKKTTEEIR